MQPVVGFHTDDLSMNTEDNGEKGAGENKGWSKIFMPNSSALCHPPGYLQHHSSVLSHPCCLSAAVHRSFEKRAVKFREGGPRTPKAKRKHQYKKELEKTRIWDTNTRSLRCCRNTWQLNISIFRGSEENNPFGSIISLKQAGITTERFTQSNNGQSFLINFFFTSSNASSVDNKTFKLLKHSSCWLHLKQGSGKPEPSKFWILFFR